MLKINLTNFHFPIDSIVFCIHYLEGVGVTKRPWKVSVILMALVTLVLLFLWPVMKSIKRGPLQLAAILLRDHQNCFGFLFLLVTKQGCSPQLFTLSGINILT